jgi:predicted nucleic acid-binding protein
VVHYATCNPVIQEVFQGLRKTPQLASFREAFLAMPRLSDPVPLQVFLDAAEIYSRGRQRGWTVRSSTGCLIAAIAISNGVPVWHRDRDFALIARYTALETVEPLARRPSPAR